jgi:hypothetical protein
MSYPSANAPEFVVGGLYRCKNKSWAEPVYDSSFPMRTVGYLKVNQVFTVLDIEQENSAYQILIAVTGQIGWIMKYKGENSWEEVTTSTVFFSSSL